MFEKLFGEIILPVKPLLGANGATIALIEEPVKAAAATEAFFGGYAEDLLADIGMDLVDEQPQAELRTKRA